MPENKRVIKDILNQREYIVRNQVNRPGRVKKAILSFLLCFVFVNCLSLFSACTDHAKRTITISAAANLITAFDKLRGAFQKKTGIQVICNFASSGKLSQQIEHGAPVDMFFSANTEYILKLANKKIIDSDSIKPYASGRLVFYSRQPDLIPSNAEDLNRDKIERIAIANPEHAPYGVISRTVLKNNRLWDRLQQKLIVVRLILIDR